MKSDLAEVSSQSRKMLQAWIDSCTRGGKVSRNTIAIGIVVLDHLRRTCPVERRDVISKGGELKGARSGLTKILEKYRIPGSFLREVTTRQGHQDGQRLFDSFDWGKSIMGLPTAQREELLLELIGRIVSLAIQWLKRQSLRLNVDRRDAPATWIRTIIDNAKDRSAGIVEQHLVGAKLERRFPKTAIPNHPAHAGDLQTSRVGDFQISKLVYHVTAAPGRKVMQRCAENVTAGLRPILLVPTEQVNKARVLAQDEQIENQLGVISIEDFIALNIIELATEENKELFAVLIEIVAIYNRRLAAVETDLSLQIEVR